MYNETNIFLNYRSRGVAYKINCGDVTHYTPLDTDYVISTYILTAIIALMLIPIFTLNFLISYVIYFTKSLHTPSNVLLASTTICDMMASILAMPAWPTVWLLAMQQEHNCPLFVFTIFTSHCFAYTSFLLVSFISMDRYIAIFKPFVYSCHVTMSFYLRCVVGLCIFILVINGISFFTSDKTLIEAIVMSSLPIFILHSFYVHLKVKMQVVVVRKRINAIKLKPKITEMDCSQIASARPTSVQGDPVRPTSSVQGDPVSSKKSIEKNVNISHLTFLLLVSLCICYSPYISILAIWRLKPSTKRSNFLQALYMWSYASICLKSLLNPIIFCYRSRMLKRKLLSIFSRTLLSNHTEAV